MSHDTKNALPSDKTSVAETPVAPSRRRSRRVALVALAAAAVGLGGAGAVSGLQPEAPSEQDRTLAAAEQIARPYSCSLESIMDNGSSTNPPTMLIKLTPRAEATQAMEQYGENVTGGVYWHDVEVGASVNYDDGSLNTDPEEYTHGSAIRVTTPQGTAPDYLGPDDYHQPDGAITFGAFLDRDLGPYESGTTATVYVSREAFVFDDIRHRFVGYEPCGVIEVDEAGLWHQADQTLPDPIVTHEQTTGTLTDN